ncbi:MAG: lipocalin family protein, partial [Prevotella sp.]|nr:lipocalin family protein [Prevotella sp.]
LRVSFWGPFYSDYRIMLLDDDYQYALIGSGSDDYLWILSRTPQITDELKSMILAEAQRRGYDTNKLIWVKQ